MKRWILILCAALMLCASCASCGKKEAEPAASASPQAALQLEQGQRYLKEGKYEEAVGAFREAIDSGTAGVEAYTGLYEAYAALEDMESAVHALGEGYEATGEGSLGTLYASRLAELAELYMEDDNYDGAADAYERLIALDGSNVEYYLTLSDIYLTIEDYERSVGALERGYQATGDEDLRDIWFSELLSQGEMLLEYEDYEQAISCFETLLENGSAEADVYTGLAEAYSGLDEYEKAFEILSQAPDPEDAGVKWAMAAVKIRYGELKYSEGNTEEAVALLKEAMEADPDEAEAYTLLITIYMETDRPGEAGAVVESGVARFMAADSSVDRDELDSFLSIAADYYMMQEDLDASARFLELAGQLRPGDEAFQDTLNGIRSMIADEAYARGEELLMQGDASGASVQFKRAFSLSPDNFEAGLYATDTATYYFNEDGSYLTGWYEADGGERFYFNPAAGSSYGQAVTGWQEIDGALYYFEEGGSMLIDDYAPDGRYVGTDGRLAEDEAPEEETEEDAGEEDAGEEPEEDEEWTEDETESESGSMSGSGSGSAGGNTSSAGSGGGSSGGNADAAGRDILTLNPDTLRRIQESGKGETVQSSELFRLSGSRVSLNDIYTSLEKYGAVVWVSEEAPYQISMGGLTLWIQPEDGWSGGAVVVQDATQYKKALFAKALPEEFGVSVEVGSGLDIDRIERINGQ